MLPAAGPARLAIYDVAGRHLATLLDGMQPAGSTPLVWTRRSAAGAAVPAGVYFARLETPASPAETLRLVVTP
jgi:hypothetical protein